ncbi:MAG: pyridine nucleotide-disulfide oxidoreductase, partial [Erysipelotrichaceae bacterium]|nr:pyridine nucleotide-disulfide oxidoreductase [Erysipelotrichaceae bacterium]
MGKKTKEEMRMTNRTDFRPDPNYRSIDKEKEKLVLKLGTMITDRYLIKYTNTMKTTDPEFWALNAVLTKAEVKFLLSFKKTRVPYFPEEIAKRNNMSLEETQKMI